MRRLFTIMFAAVAFSAWAGEGPARFDYLSQLGVAEINVAAYGCLVIANDTLQVGEAITLISPAAPQKIIDTTIRKKLASSCSRNTEYPPGASFYSFRAGNKPMDPSVAIVRFPGEYKVVKGTVRADLNGDGVFESFRSCTSTEGLHLTVWSGEPLTTHLAWHEYFYLGYDVEPNCTPGEYGE